jgi:outer membrane protein
MIKKLLLSLLVAVPFLAPAQTQVKLAVVNSLEVLNAMPEKTTAEATLKTFSDKYEAEFKKLQTEFNQKYADYQALANDASTPQTIKERRMQELQENDQKIQEFQKKANADIQSQQQSLLAPVKEKLQKAIQTVGEEGGFAMIFDVSTTPVPYKSAAIEDVTAKVKEKLGIK